MRGLMKTWTYLVGLHLQTGRGLVKNMIPPVEAELLSFFMTDLRGEADLELRNLQLQQEAFKNQLNSLLLCHISLSL